MSNGGVIGADNRATAFTAPGVWNIQDLYNFRVVNSWPILGLLDNNLVEFVMKNAVGGIQGTVFENVNFVHPVGNTEGRFTADSSNDTFTITTSGPPAGHLLTTNDIVFFQEGSPGDLPPPIVPNLPYFIESVPSTTTFKLTQQLGGPVVSLTGNGIENADRKIFKIPKGIDPKIEIEIYHYDAATYPSGLTISGTTSVGEDVDADRRLTCIVVDKNLVINSGGTLNVTNNRRRFGFFIASRENVEISGTWTIPNVELTQPSAGPDPTFRRWKVIKNAPFANSYINVGGDGGQGHPSQGFSGATGGGGGGGASPGGSVGIPGAGTPRGAPGNGTRGGNGAGGVGPTGAVGQKGGDSKNIAVVVGDNVTLSGPGPTVRIDMKGQDGLFGSPSGGSSGGAGGGKVHVYYKTAFTNNATINVNGGAPGGSPATGGTAGYVVSQQIASF